MLDLLPGQNGDLITLTRVAQIDPEQEPVELGFRKREGSFVFDRVLSSQDDKWLGKSIGRAVNRHLSLFHTFEERRLCLRSGSINLIGQDDLGDDRAGAILELLLTLIVDRNAGHIAWEEVWGELNASKCAADRAGKSLGEDGLPDAGNVLDQHVSLAEQRDKSELDFVVLPDDDLFDITDHLFGDRLKALHA